MSKSTTINRFALIATAALSASAFAFALSTSAFAQGADGTTRGGGHSLSNWDGQDFTASAPRDTCERRARPPT